MWLHRLGAFFILSSTLFYGGYALVKLKHIHWDVHGPLGTTMTILVSLIVLSGLITRNKMQNAVTKDYKSSIDFKRIHKFFGWFMISLGHITVCFGLYAYFRNRNMSTTLPYLVFLANLTVVIISEFKHRSFLARTDIKMTELSLGHATLTNEEVKEIMKSTDRMMVIVGDMLVDITDFVWEHPGGAICLRQHRGKDVSCFFYGGLG